MLTQITNLNDLPEEIHLDILSRLSIRCVVRFMCVSKQWHSLIEVHLKSLPPQPKKVMVLAKYESCCLLSIDESGHVERVSSRQWKKQRSSFCSSDYLRGSISNSCNGLFLVGIEEDLFLWNPLTKYSKKVLSYNRLEDKNYRVVYGLCHDTSNNEYKAVIALSHSTPAYGGEFTIVGCFRRKRWTEVPFPYNVGQIRSGPGPIVNENLHWFITRSKRFLSPHRIVSFNPRTNKFHKVPMPLSLLQRAGDEDAVVVLGLGVLEGCLSIVCLDQPSPSYHGSKNVVIMAMKEYGNEKSWTIMFTLSNLPGLNIHDELVPLCFTNNGEIMLNHCGSGVQYGNCIWAYNPDDESRRTTITIPHFWHVEAMVYEETSVKPPSYNWEEREKRRDATYVEHLLDMSPRQMKKNWLGWEWDRSSKRRRIG